MPVAQSSKGQKGKGSTKGGGGGGNGGKGGGLSASSRTQPGDWACLLCGVQANRDWRERCRNCEAYRNVQMETVFNEHAKKQMQQQRRNTQTQQQQRQRQQQQQAQANKDDDDRRRLRQQVERLRAELAASRMHHMQVDEDEGDEDEEDVDESTRYSAWSEEERSKRIDLARGGLAYAVAAHGEDSDQAQRLRDEISAIQKASREAKPFKAHRNQLERRKEDLQRKQDRDEAAIAAAQVEISELQEKVKTLQATVDDRAKQLRQVSDELNEIVRKALEEGRDEEGKEGDKNSSAGAQAGAHWTTLAAAASGLVGHPGVPQDVASLLAQLQQVASAFTMEATATKARPGSTDPPPTGAAAATAEVPTVAKPKAPAPATPIVLAPHGRFGKAAAAMRGSQPPASTPQPSTPPAGTDSSSGEAATNGDSGTGATYAAVAGANPAGTGKADEGKGRSSNESEAELVEDNAGDGGPAAMDVEESIAKLPDQDQRRIRAAIRGGAARSQRKGGEEADTEAEDGGRRERERSPRPTKHGDKDL